MYHFGRTSLKRLEKVEPALCKIAHRALEISPYDFGIACGLRSVEKQRKAVKNGNSTTMHSRHLPNERGLSEAIDLMVFVNGKYERNNTAPYRKVVQAFMTAAIELGVQIELGALWGSFIDTPHIQLNRKYMEHS